MTREEVGHLGQQLSGSGSKRVPARIGVPPLSRSTPMSLRTIQRAMAAFGLACALVPVLAVAQGYPSRPIKLVVPLAPGGTGDTLARAVGDEMSKELGQPFVIENKPGAGGLVGTELVANAPPDGYTLVMVSPSHTINPMLHAGKKTYDPLKGFEM